MSPYKDYSELRPEILGIFSPSDRKTDSACIRMGRNHGSGGRPLGSKDKDQRTRTVEGEEGGAVREEIDVEQSLLPESLFSHDLEAGARDEGAGALDRFKRQKL